MEQDGLTETNFTGTFDHTLDTKGRVSLPAKFRRYLPSVQLKILPMGKSVYLFSSDSYDKWFKSYFPDGRNPRSEDDNLRSFYLTANTDETDIDSAGRISISAKLRQAAGLGKEVSIIGAGDHIEIMSRDACAARLEAASKLFGF